MDVEHPPGGKRRLDPDQKPSVQSLIHVTCKSLEYGREPEPLEETNAVTAEQNNPCTVMYIQTCETKLMDTTSHRGGKRCSERMKLLLARHV